MTKNLYISLIIVVNIAIDQITKIIVRANLVQTNDTQQGDRIQVIGEFFQLMNVENTGAFLGMGSDLGGPLKVIGLLILPILVLGYLIYYIFKNKNKLDKTSLIALCCIAGGGIANVFDRIVFGSVTDFLFIKITETIRTGIFNVADMSVTFGMIALIFSNFFGKKKTETEEVEA